ncbi:MAG: hypothetical protein C0482_22840 [Gordonia sp.]|nr:hypothetical protein [Gordonia sp. (in: high G+C Gram-positive bacteria)]
MGAHHLSAVPDEAGPGLGYGPPDRRRSTSIPQEQCRNERQQAQRDRFATAIHEAAHAVIATVYGGTISSAVLTPGDPDTGGRVT